MEKIGHSIRGGKVFDQERIEGKEQEAALSFEVCFNGETHIVALTDEELTRIATNQMQFVEGEKEDSFLIDLEAPALPLFIRAEKVVIDTFKMEMEIRVVSMSVVESEHGGGYYAAVFQVRKDRGEEWSLQEHIELPPVSAIEEVREQRRLADIGHQVLESAQN